MSTSESEAIEVGAPPEARLGISSRGPLKKILFVSNTNEYGGAEKHSLKLIRRLRGPQVQIKILCLDMDLFTERLSPDDAVEIITCKKSPEYLRDWVALFRDIRPDVAVFIYGWFWAFPWLAVVGAWRAGIRRRFSIQHLFSAPWPVTERFRKEWIRRNSVRRRLARLLGREPREKPAWMTGLPLCIPASLSTPLQLKLSACLCKRTICVSDDLRQRLVKNFGFPAWKVKAIHNGVSVSEYVPSESRGAAMRRRLGLGQDEFILVCVARLSEQKGIDILIQSMARVLRDGVRCRCVIVGDGPLRDQFVEKARELGVPDQVLFVGFQKDVRAYLQAGLLSYSPHTGKGCRYPSLRQWLVACPHRHGCRWQRGSHHTASSWPDC